MELFKRIVHPTDFSSASDAALELALTLTNEYDGELILLHVLDDPHLSEEEDRCTAAKKQAMARLEELQRRCDGVRCRFAVEVGPAAQTIVWYAWTENADLIVMGTHGATGLKHTYIGSVAEKVIRRARCPVLVIRPSSPNEPPPERPEFGYTYPEWFM